MSVRPVDMPVARAPGAAGRSAIRAAAVVLPVLALAAGAVGTGVLNLGQALSWLAFFSGLVASFGFLAGAMGRPGSLPVGRVAFTLQWVFLLAAAAVLWQILFTHDFRFQYVAAYSSKAMPGHYVYAAFWGGQEGTFLLWAFLTSTLGLILMRWRHPLQPWSMFFLTMPLIMLGLVTVMRGPFLMFPPDRVPLDGAGLNPLLQDPWMTIHPPVLFVGFSSFVLPFAIAMAGLVRRDWDGWIKPVLPWVVFSTAIQATGFIMGGVWAYKVLGWGGYWGWDPVENGSLIPWLSNIALLHGLLVQRVTGALRRTNFFLAILSYVLVLYASFLTRSGVLADFSVHSFANLGLSGFLLTFLGVVGVSGFGLWLWRSREIPGSKEPLGSFSRESFMWLGQLVFLLMCGLVTVGMSAPLITRLFGPPSNVQTSYYNLVNAPLAIAMGLLLGVSPLMRWRQHEPSALGRAVVPALVVAALFAAVAVWWGVRDPIPAAVVFAMAFAFAANVIVTVRGFRAGWKHGAAFLGHAGVALLLVGVIASSNYGLNAQVQLPKGEQRSALGYQMTFQGMETSAGGQERAVIAVATPERKFTAHAPFFWSEYNQGYMKKPHVENFPTHDIYISPLEMVGADGAESGTWFTKGESKMLGQVKYTFIDFDAQMGEKVRVTARMTAEQGGRTVPLKPVFEMDLASNSANRIPDYLPGGGAVSIVKVDPNAGRVLVELPGAAPAAAPAEVLAVEVSTKPFIGLVWIGAIVMLVSAFLSMWRRVLDVRRERHA